MTNLHDFLLLITTCIYKFCLYQHTLPEKNVDRRDKCIGSDKRQNMWRRDRMSNCIINFWYW